MRAVIAFALALVLALPLEALGRGLLDRRRMLTAEEHTAWRAVGRVNIALFDERGMCTGTLIAEDIVLTAAHCVISSRTGEIFAPGNIHFVAGWRQGQSVGHSKAASITIHPRYRHQGDDPLEQIGTDLALIRLRQAIPPQAAPAFRVAPTPGGDASLTLISYRRDRAHALTRQEGCEVRGAEGSVLALGCDVTFGASGSPVFAEIDGERRLVAVISAMSRTRGQNIAWAVRVDEAIAELLFGLELKAVR
ncbi:MAG: trypsin-like serine protease [Pseudomonadota bacterium]